MTDIQPFDGISNFRDFGGFDVDGGGRAPHGRLLRSAHLADATEADLARLQAMRLAVVVDLRRRTERLKQPSRLPHGYAGLVIASDDGDLGESPHVTLLRQGPPTAEGVEAYLTDYYGKAYFLPRHRALFASAFAALAAAQGATLVHCAAGKDRTGLLVALIRTALGGRWNETLADFLATNQATMTPRRMAETTVGLQALLGAPPEPAVLQAFLGVWPHHLETAFASLKDRYGSTDGYLKSLGVDAAMRAKLVERLVT